MKTVRLAWVVPLCLLAVFSCGPGGRFQLRRVEGCLLYIARSIAECWTAPGLRLHATGTHKRRKEILRLFETEVYGRSPARPSRISFTSTKSIREALAGPCHSKASDHRVERSTGRPHDGTSALHSKCREEAGARFSGPELQRQSIRSFGSAYRCQPVVDAQTTKSSASSTTAPPKLHAACRAAAGRWRRF